MRPHLVCLKHLLRRGERAKSIAAFLLLVSTIGVLNLLFLLHYLLRVPPTLRQLRELLPTNTPGNNGGVHTCHPAATPTAARLDSNDPATPPRPPAYGSDADIRVWRILAEVVTDNWTASRLPKSELGFDVTYDRRRVLEEEPRLEVVVMPQSHNDPGHKKTFLETYKVWTSHVLSAAQRYLSGAQDVTFGWVEMIFLDVWWQNSGAEERQAFKRLVDSGQVEILTGGWVMSDEATTHYYGLVMQLLEGHEWLRNHLGANATPVTHYNIDSSGLSPTVAYLLSEAGIRQGMAKRAHHAIKSHLAERRQLEFRWRQAWAGASDASNDFLLHLTPLYGTHVSYNCGVDPKVCCQFDFHHVGEMCYGGWGGRVVGINESNVAEKAALLTDQFRKKAQLYKGNTIFVPLGEDYRFLSEEEWATTILNLRLLFDHINAHPQLYNMHVRFGTPRHYFNLLRELLSSSNLTTSSKGMVKKEKNNEFAQVMKGSKCNSLMGELPSVLPTLSGDFFPYSGVSNRYWTGRYTTRAFHKQLDRWLQHYLRAADILYTAALTARTKASLPSRRPPPPPGVQAALESRLIDAYPQLVVARRALSLFQHHDAITGTSNERVMHDYAVRLLDAINTCMTTISQATALILNLAAVSTTTKTTAPPLSADSSEANENSNSNYNATITANATIMTNFSPSFHSNLHINLHHQLHFVGMKQPQQRVVPPGTKVVLFNSLGFERNEVVCMIVPIAAAAATTSLSPSAVLHQKKKKKNGREGGGGGRGMLTDEKEGLPLIYEFIAASGEEGSEEWNTVPLQQLQPLIVEVDNESRSRSNNNNNHEGLTFAKDKAELCFLAQLPAMGFRIYYMGNASAANKEETFRLSVARLRFKGRVSVEGELPSLFLDAEANTRIDQVEEGVHHRENPHITIANERVSLSFHPWTGLLQQMAKNSRPEQQQQQDHHHHYNYSTTTSQRQGEHESFLEKTTISTRISFVRYRPQHYEGAPHPVFAFHPDGPAQPLQNSKQTEREGAEAEGKEGNAYVLIEGPVRKSVVVRLGGPYRLLHAVELDAHSDAPTIRNRVDLSHLRGEEVEVGMRLQSDPRLTDFYTEVNAYQFVRRRRIAEVPLGGKFYPMPGAAFIEQGRNQRLSLLGRQSLGVASLEPGWMEVMLDRRLNNDGRHLDGISDNYPTESMFRLVWERFPSSASTAAGAKSGGDDRTKQQTLRLEKSSTTTTEADTAYHSLDAHHLSLGLQYPVVVQYSLGVRSMEQQQEQHSSQNRKEQQQQWWWNVNSGAPITLFKEALPLDVHLVSLRTLSNATDYDSMPPPSSNSNYSNATHTLVDHFTSLTTRPKRAAVLILHRVGVECSLVPLSPLGTGREGGISYCAGLGDGAGLVGAESPATWSNNGSIKLDALFVVGGGGDDSSDGSGGGKKGAHAHVIRRPSRVAEASLTLLRVAHASGRGGNVSELVLRPMEIKSWQLDF